MPAHPEAAMFQKHQYADGFHLDLDFWIWGDEAVLKKASVRELKLS